jgi:hypothetical protein
MVGGGGGGDEPGVFCSAGVGWGGGEQVPVRHLKKLKCSKFLNKNCILNLTLWMKLHTADYGKVKNLQEATVNTDQRYLTRVLLK